MTLSSARQRAAALSEPGAALQRLQGDPVMARLINMLGPCGLAAREETPFQVLATSIIGQQISSQAAASIKRRLLMTIPEFTAGGLLAVTPQQLRDAGLSGAKIRYLTQISRVTEDDQLDFESLRQQSDDDVIRALIALPGVGRWTAEMFLIFAFQRPDVLALGDAGLKRAVRRLYGDHVTLAAAGESWRPFASTASWYLWQSLDMPADHIIKVVQGH